MSDKNDTTFIPGVERSAIVLFDGVLRSFVYWEAEKAKAVAQREAEKADIDAKYAPYLAVASENLRNAQDMLTSVFLLDFEPKAESLDDIRTMAFASGTVEWHQASEDMLIIDDEAQLLRWGKRHGVLKQMLEWRQHVLKTLVKKLLKKRPELLSTLKGARLVRSRSLSVKTALNTTPIYKSEEEQETVI